MAVPNLRLKIVALVAFTLLTMATFLYLFTQAGGRLRLDEPYNARAIVPEALNIVNNSDVRRDGGLALQAVLRPVRALLPHAHERAGARRPRRPEG